MACGLASAFEGSRADVQQALAQGGRQIGGGLRHRRLRHAFVIAEIALAVVLLVGAGLMLRSFASMRQVDPGFDSANVLTMRMQLPRAKYPDDSARIRFFREVTERVAGPSRSAGRGHGKLFADGGPRRGHELHHRRPTARRSGPGQDDGGDRLPKWILSGAQDPALARAPLHRAGDAAEARCRHHQRSARPPVFPERGPDRKTGHDQHERSERADGNNRNRRRHQGGGSGHARSARTVFGLIRSSPTT